MDISQNLWNPVHLTTYTFFSLFRFLVKSIEASSSRDGSSYSCKVPVRVFMDGSLPSESGGLSVRIRSS